MIEKKKGFKPGGLNDLKRGQDKVSIIKEEEEKVESKIKDSSIIGVTDIPSKFIPYPENSTISYRPYKFGEIKNYNESKNISPEDQIKFVLSGIFVEGFEILDLTLSDFLFLALLRKLSSIGDSEIAINYRCDECGFINKEIIKTSEIDIDYLPVTALPVIVELSDGEEFHFMPLTIGNYLDSLKDGSFDDQISLLSRTCKNKSYTESFDYFFNLTNTQDFVLLGEIDKYLYHSVKPIEFKCKNEIERRNKLTGEKEKFVCEFVNEVEVDGGDIFINPFRDDREFVKNRIRFGI